MSKKQGYALVTVLVLLALGGPQILGSLFGLAMVVMLAAPIVGVARLGTLLSRINVQR